MDKEMKSVNNVKPFIGKLYISLFVILVCLTGIISNIITQDKCHILIINNLIKPYPSRYNNLHAPPPTPLKGQALFNYDSIFKICKKSKLALNPQAIKGKVKYPYLYISDSFNIIPFLNIIDYGYVGDSIAMGGTVVFINFFFTQYPIYAYNSWSVDGHEQEYIGFNGIGSKNSSVKNDGD